MEDATGSAPLRVLRSASQMRCKHRAHKQSSVHSGRLMIRINGSLIKCFIPAWRDLIYDSQINFTPKYFCLVQRP